MGTQLSDPGAKVTRAVQPASRSTKPATLLIVGAAGRPFGVTGPVGADHSLQYPSLPA